MIGVSGLSDDDDGKNDGPEIETRGISPLAEYIFTASPLSSF
jgi:hypothetical protein